MPRKIARGRATKSALVSRAEPATRRSQFRGSLTEQTPLPGASCAVPRKSFPLQIGKELPLAVIFCKFTPMKALSSMTHWLWFGSAVALSAAPSVPTFRAVEIDSKIEIGYGVTVADVDGDKKPDILLVD